MSVEFCDTNVVVYARDASAGRKRDIARGVMTRLWESGEGAVSVQVLQETYVNLLRKPEPPLPPSEARAAVANLARWRVITPDAQDVLRAVDASGRWRTSFWDAMILVA